MKKHKIYAAFRLSYASHRQFLAGIATYIHQHPGWQVIVAPDFTDFSEKLIAEIFTQEYDGIITVAPRSSPAQKALAHCKLPTVIISSSPEDLPERTMAATFLRGEPSKLSETALQYFSRLGKFASYVYLDAPISSRWARERLTGFLAAAKTKKIHPTVIISPHQPGSRADLDFIRESLLRLNRPIAVLAAYDQRALDLLAACNLPQLSIPKHVSVLGVDNDAVLCDFSQPPLSSIATGPQTRGAEGMIELRRLLTAKRTPGIRTIFTADYQIVERESSAPVITSAHLVEKAREFIAKNSCSGIGVNDIAQHLHVSRSLLTRLFKNYTDTTVKKEINAVRLKRLKKLLTDSRLPINKVSTLAGFPEPNYAKRFFRKAIGCSMREFRQRSR